MSWYNEFFRENWLYVQRNLYSQQHSAKQVEQLIEQLNLVPGMSILDVPVGTGRIAVEFAYRGFRVCGVDLSTELLEDATAAAQQCGVEIELQQRDMRDLPWKNEFDAAINWWGSFGYFDDSGNEAFADAVYQTLQPGGVWVIDSSALETIAVNKNPRSWMRVGDALVLEERNYDFLSGVMESHWTILLGEKQSLHTSKIRQYSIPELTSLLKRIGFRQLDVLDSTGKEFEFGRRMLLTARR